MNCDRCDAEVEEYALILASNLGMTTCATCLYFRREPGTIRRAYGVCFRRHVFDGYGWTAADETACARYVGRIYQRTPKDGLCACCSRPVNMVDRYCRTCGMALRGE